MPETQQKMPKNTHWLITGASGLLGHSLAKSLIGQGYTVTGLCGSNTVDVPGVREFSVDVTEERQVRSRIEESGAQIIVHAAGLTNVDECERNPDAAQRSHVDATRHIAAAAETIGARMVYVSTDHLWDGLRPFVTEDQPPYPINVYARTKLRGEEIALSAGVPTLAIRTNFFGRGRPWRKSLSDWILDRLADDAPLNMFTDSFFTPISLEYLNGFMVELVRRDTTGILNVAGRDRVSKFDFARTLAEKAGYSSSNIRRASVATFGLAAPRPHDMSLDTSRVSAVLGRAMPSLDESIATLFPETSLISAATQKQGR